MKKTILAASIAVGAAFHVCATDLAYTAGDTDLDGKVAITYDGAGRATSLVATPADGETLTIVSSDDLTFADGATVSMTAGGSLVFALDVIAEGALSLDRTDGAYYDWTGPKDNTPSTGALSSSESRINWKAAYPMDFMEWNLIGVYAYADTQSSRPGPNLGGAYTYVSHEYKGDTQTEWGTYWRTDYVFSRWTGADTKTVTVKLVGWDDYEFQLSAESDSDLTELNINRAVFAKNGASPATVGFSENVTLGGETSVALGVKLVVLPKANATFAAPVFSGEGDVELQRDATLANANLMKYASELTVRGATVYVADAGAFPTNAIVTVFGDATVRVDPSISDGERPSGEPNADGSARSVSGGWYDLVVQDGGQVHCCDEILNGGKVEVTYDDAAPSKIARLVAIPEGGETVTVTGGAMTFVDGATVAMAADGELNFANDVMAEGTIALIRTDGAYYDWTGPKGNTPNAGPLSESSVTRVNWKTVRPMDFEDWSLLGVYGFADTQSARPGPNLGGAYTFVSKAQQPRQYYGDDYYDQDDYVFSRWTGADTKTVTVKLLAWNDHEFQLLAETDGDVADLDLNRAVFKKDSASPATVAFSGDVALYGQTTVALGVKLAVLPKAGSAFEAPEFAGEGDVELQRDATFATANTMKYASELVVRGATLRVTDAGAFPTNAIVTVGGDAEIVFDRSVTTGEAPSVEANADGSARSVSSGWYDLVVEAGGTLRYCDFLCGGKVEVEYDATDATKVKRLAARPEGGETVTVPAATGAMAFAGGAEIALAADGALVFENDVTSAGALSLKRTDGAFYDWTGTKPGNFGAGPLGAARTIANDKVLNPMDFADWSLVSVYGFADSTGTPSPNHAGAYRKVGKSESVYHDAGEWGHYWEDVYTFSRWTGAETKTVDVTLHGWSDHEFQLFASCEDGDAEDLYINRAVFKKDGSETATVAFGGDAGFGGAVDVALGVKLVVMPKANTAFAAPVFSGEGDVEYRRDATLANANLMKYASGLSVTGATVTVTAGGVFPTNCVADVWNGGVVNVAWGNTPAYGDGVSGNSFDLNVHEGGEYRLAGGESYTDGGVGTYTRTAIDGGTLWIGYPEGTAGSCVVDFLSLANGAVATGNWVRVIDDGTTSPYWKSSGTAATSIGCGVNMVKGQDAANPEFVIDVEDIDGVADDCVMNGSIRALNNDTDNHSCSVVKKGAGTLKMNGTISSLLPTRVEGGALVFGASGGVAEPSMGIELDGAALGKESGALAAGALTVAGDARLDLGTDATMSFADSSGATWTGTLTVENFRNNAIRFGTDASGLTDAQLARIQTEDGKKLGISSYGYLVGGGGLLLLFK